MYNLNNKLRRDDLINVKEKFVNKIKDYEIFDIPDKLYLEFLEEIENLFNNHKFYEDERFVTYGRLSFLRDEFTSRLHDKTLNVPTSNWKDKWDNRMGAFYDLSDYIIGDYHIAISNVPNNESFYEVIEKNDSYYKDGYICKQEKEAIVSMLEEFKEFINNRKNMSR